MRIHSGVPLLLTMLLVVATSVSTAGATTTRSEDALRWIDGDSLAVEGRPFDVRSAPWDRLPAKAESIVRPPVWGNSRHSAGISIRFVSDSPTIAVRWRVTSDRLSMPHMPATGVSGVDLYVRLDRPTGSTWRWVANGRPTAVENERVLVSDLPVTAREWLLYLPLYNGVSSIEIGIAADSTITPGPERGRPIVFYGTSITHGACASRPGMTHVAILGRRLDVPVVNLGFSGSGTLDPEMADLMAEIDACVYVLDCLPNLDGDRVAARAAPFVRRLRTLRPEVPIVLVEDRTYADAIFDRSKARRNRENRAALRTAHAELRAEGVGDLFYLEGDTLLGGDGEATVDSSHPTDLGFMRQADALEPVIRAAYGASTTESTIQGGVEHGSP